MLAPLEGGKKQEDPWRRRQGALVAIETRRPYPLSGRLARSRATAAAWKITKSIAQIFATRLSRARRAY